MDTGSRLEALDGPVAERLGPGPLATAFRLPGRAGQVEAVGPVFDRPDRVLIPLGLSAQMIESFGPIYVEPPVGGPGRDGVLERPKRQLPTFAGYGGVGLKRQQVNA